MFVFDPVPRKVPAPFPVESYQTQPLQDICRYLRTDGSGRIVCPQVNLGWGAPKETLNEYRLDAIQEWGAHVFLSSLSVPLLLTGQTTETEIQVGRALYGDR